MSNPMELVFDEARRRELFNGLPCELTANVGAIRQHYLRPLMHGVDLVQVHTNFEKTAW